MRFSDPRARRRELGEINVTSLVDIIFILLIFFLLTTSFSSESAGLEVELPEASAADMQVAPNDLVIALTKEGEIVVRGETVDLEQVRGLMREHKAQRGSGTVFVQADAEVPHGRVVEVVDMAKAEGVPRLGIATQSQ